LKGVKMNPLTLSQNEQNIIISAINNAKTWGGGWLTYSQEAIEDAGLEWTEKHERFAFNYGSKE